jgi:hypothetical protein
LLAEGVVDAGEHGAETEQPETADAHGEGRNQRAEHAEAGAKHEAGTAAIALHEKRGGQGGQCAAYYVGGDRQGGQPLVGGKLQAEQAVDGDQHDAVGQQQGLRPGQQRDVLPVAAHGAGGSISAR